MFRDRTNLYLSYRQSYTHRPPPLNAANDPFLGPGETIELANMPPNWLGLSSQVDGALTGIRAQIAELSALHKRNVLPGFDDRTEQEKTISTLTLRITQGLHKCQSIVKQFDGLAHETPDAATRKMSANVRASMASKVQEVSALFRKMQSSYLRQLRKDPSPSMGFELEQDVALSRQTLAQTQDLMQEQQHVDLDLARRESEINQIAEGILDVAEIFKDLQTMVIDQGTLLDRIDYNVQTMHSSVQDAHKQLTKGERHQKRTQKCKIIMLLTLICLGLVLLLILKPRR